MEAVTKAVPYLETIVREKLPKDFTWSSCVIEDEGHVPYANLYEGLRSVFSPWKYIFFLKMGMGYHNI